MPDPTPRQLEIADYLQYGPRDQIIMAFRGVGKSWICSAFVCWLLYRQVNLKIMVVSASQPRADKFTTFTLRLIKEWPILSHLTPKADQRESMVCFDVCGASNAHAPSVLSIGITGQMTGNRGDIIIGDDVEVPKNSCTDDLREKLLARVGEFHDIIVPEGEPRVIFLGTPQTEESIYNKLRTRGYECRIWPARYPTARQVDGYAGALAPSIANELLLDPLLAGCPTDPGRFSEADLADRQARKGRSSFLLQFMLDTSLSDADRYPLKHGDLIVMDLNPSKAPSLVQYSSKADSQIRDIQQIGFAGDRYYRPMWVDPTWLPYEVSCLAIDPAGRGTDETGYAVVSYLHGNLFLLASGGLTGGYTDANLIALANLALEFKVNKVVIEANFGDGMWTKLFTPHLQRIYPCACEEVKVHTMKEKRIIDTLEPVMNQHRLVVAYDVIKKDVDRILENPEQNQRYSLIYQLTRLCNQRGALRSDDRVDALHLGVAYHLEAMARDTNKAQKQAEERAMQAEVDKFISAITGQSHSINQGFSHRFGR